METGETRDAPNPVRPEVCSPAGRLTPCIVFPMVPVMSAMSRRVFAECAQHKPWPISPQILGLLDVRQFFADAEYETATLLHRPCP